MDLVSKKNQEEKRMVIFYSIMMVMNIALIFKKDDQGFKPLYQKIRKHEKPSKIIVYGYVIFFGCFIFPLSITRDFSFLFLQLMGYFYLAVCFFGLESEDTLKVFRNVFVLNIIGLLFRVLLEWGEHSMMKALTVLNIGIFIIFIPSLIAFIHRIIMKNQENLEGEI